MAGSSVERKKVLLGVTGGIAAYKTPELVRRLIDADYQVQVVMTRAAHEFVTATALATLSGRRVRSELWDAEAEAAMSHIELARWADLILIAPATANCMASLASGRADDLLSTLCLATAVPVWLVPAMNQAMWANPAVQTNRGLLESRGIRLLGPASGQQACGEIGPGRLLEPADIIAALATAPGLAGLLRGVKVVVTAGPTREAIDPVRYITNRSSGKMGYAVCAAAAQAGADVVLVSGPVNLPTPAGARRVDVETAEQMYGAVHAEVGDAAIFIGCAAVSDYRPKAAAAEKIKRKSEHFQLDLVRSPDTLASVAALKSAPFTVGFAAETCNVAGHAVEKLEKKGVDLIAANRVGPACGFDAETNALELFWAGGSVQIAESSKTVVAAELIRIVAERFRAACDDNGVPRPTPALVVS
jgi:phosphopantothenoylcysteine decarboxylase/phosphopantothenate--cysteine ligase